MIIGKEEKHGKRSKGAFACHHCGAEADITLAGFEGVKDVVRRMKKAVCKSCGQEVEMEKTAKETYACDHCGAEADMTVEGFEKVEDVVKREKGVSCKACEDVPWTKREDIKAVKAILRPPTGRRYLH